MLLDIVILPPAKLRAKLVRVTKEAVGKTPIILLVDNKKLFHHISLYHLRASPVAVEKIITVLDAIAKNYRNLFLKFPKFQDGPLNPRYIWLTVAKTKPLYKLHKDVLRQTNKFRTGPMKLLSPAPPGLARRYVRQYGKIEVLKKFKPHFTLAKLSDIKDVPQVLKKLKSIKLEVAKGQILALAEVDEYWQVTRIIKRFKLNKIPSRAKRGDLKTRLLRPPTLRRSPSNGVQEALQVLKQGGIVVYPTDTAYGLAVDATNEKAVKKLYQLKGRSFKKPVHVIVPVRKRKKYLNTVKYVSIYSELGKIVHVNPSAKKLMKKFWPGPLTIVLPLKSKAKSFNMLSAGTGTLGVRSPDHPTAQLLVEALGKPITTTSANLAGKPNCYSIVEVKKQFGKSKVTPDFFLDGGKLPETKPSTVVSLVGRVKIIRQGPISEKQIKKVLRG